MGRKVVMTADFAGIPSNREGYHKAGAEFSKIHCKDEDQLISAAREADAVICLGIQPYTRKVIEALGRCRLISCIGVGVDGVDVGFATERGVCISNVVDHCNDEIAEHTMGLLLLSARKLPRLDKAIRDGKYRSLAPRTPEILQILAGIPRVKGQTLGIIGFGRLGKAVAARAKCFGMRVIAHGRSTPDSVFDEHGVEKVDLDSLLRNSDYVSLHCSLTSENRRMLGAEQFEKMKPTAYFINTARGGLVDTPALYDALSRGLIAGAALDTVEPEPLSLDSPLFKLENVFFTPHCAGFSEESKIQLCRMPEEEVFRILSGEWPRNLFNPSVKPVFLARWPDFKAGQRG